MLASELAEAEIAVFFEIQMLIDFVMFCGIRHNSIRRISKSSVSV